VTRFFLLIIAVQLIACSSDRIRDKPISFSEWRVQQTLGYVESRYGVKQESLEMLPVMVVSHYTAMDSLDVSFNYMNREEMESGRSQLKKAGGANIAVHFLVGKAGDIYRLMPENHIGRHAIGLNRHSIGIENVGNDEASLTTAQVEANELIVRRLVKKFPIQYLIGHSEYRRFEKTPIWEEADDAYRTEKHDPGESFMAALRSRVADLALKERYDRSEIAARVEFTLAGYAKKGLFAGTALVIDGGKIIYRGAYGQNAASGQPMKPENRVYLASAAKPFTALAAAILEAKGKISFESPVAPYFPQLAHLLKGVKLKHLLAHTSGLEDYYRQGLPVAPFTNQDAMALIAAQIQPLNPPGKKFVYSNSNYILIAEIVARLASVPFAEFLRSEIFSKAEMSATDFVSGLKAETAPVPATDAAGKVFRYGYATEGPGGLCTTVDDLARFDMALFSEKLIKPKSQAKLFKVQAPVEARHNQYAIGWYVYPERSVAYHDGNFGGYHSMNWLNLKKKQAIILLGNRHTDKVREITWHLDRALNGLEAKKLE
jgi:N-acetylmuramoyl-L-alanine amidase